jgi:hypothetical protein
MIGSLKSQTHRRKSVAFSILKGWYLMRVPRNLGMLLFGIWLFLTGLIQLLGLSFTGLGTLMALLALLAGGLILLDVWPRGRR